MSFIDSLRDVATQMFDSVDNSLNPGRTKVDAYKKIHARQIAKR